VKRYLLVLLKYALPLAIVAWLMKGAFQDASFGRFWSEPKDWSLLLLAALACFTAVCITFVRWYFLVRALDLPFRLRDAFRLGFLGYMFNFVAPGSVGGDLFKAVFIAREHPGRRTSAIASVIADRLIGLYALFVVACGAFYLTDVGRAASQTTEFRVTAQAVLICTVVGTIGGLLLLIPALTDNKFALRMEKWPKVGRLIHQLHTTIRMYRSRVGVLLLANILSVGVHSLFSVAFYLIATALPGEAPSLAAHFVIAPLSMLAGILPMPANGLGVVEGIMKILYQHIAPNPQMIDGLGLLVALTYRLITVLIAGIGFIYYLVQRREVNELRHAAEELPADDDETTVPDLDTATAEGMVSA